MALSALNCTRCGAALRDEPLGGLIRCSHCGQNHAFQAPAPPPPPTPAPLPLPVVATPPALAWKLPVVVLGAIVVVGVAAAVMLQSRAAQTGAYVAAGAEGPGDPNASYAAGQAVDVYWSSSWWPGTIKSVLGDGRYRIGYEGWSSSWDEDVTPRRLRQRGSTPAAVADKPATDTPATDRPATVSEGSGDPKATYAAGEVVDIHWGQRWWPGRVLAVKGQRYHVTYDGWSSTHDETVDASRLRRR